jgi:hypothetical protein
MAGVNGTTLQLAGELFKMMAGVDMLHVRIRAQHPHSPTCSVDRCK